MKMGIAFLTQTAVGILGNSCLLCFYGYTQFTGQKVRPIDPILIHLVFATNFVVLSRGIPQTMAGFGCKYFLDDAASTLYFYSYSLDGQKMKPTDPICHHLVFANNLVVLSRGIPKIMARFGWKYFLDDAPCKVVLYFNRVARGVFLNTTCLLSGFQVALFSSIDVMCLVFMMWASGSMVLVRHRHMQKVQHIHSLIPSGRSDPEARARVPS
ncbi:vomeronasal type-1 receptor 1-like [Dipodomys merriami]|uniref:vomeronasal type-1 receptor 1-like n=1 Tax=Dipodomys merriami TaxID=94247 RepID=UPI0038557E7D